MTHVVPNSQTGTASFRRSYAKPSTSTSKRCSTRVHTPHLHAARSPQVTSRQFAGGREPASSEGVVRGFFSTPATGVHQGGGGVRGALHRPSARILQSKGGATGGRSSRVTFAASGGSVNASSSVDADKNKKGLPSWFPMHDFCLTFPWGLFVALGGLAGFAIAGSTKSLIFGCGFGTLLMALAGLSLKKWKAFQAFNWQVACRKGSKTIRHRSDGPLFEAGGSSTPYTAGSLLISTALMAVMGKKWMAGASFIPAGLIAVAAAFMGVFYIHNMATGGNPPTASKED